MQNFRYINHDQAVADLRIFSSMNANEDKALYLAERRGSCGWHILNKMPLADDLVTITAIGLNGIVFFPA